MSPRPVWTGTLSFGLLSIPVKTFVATRDHDLRFNQIEKSTGARIRQKKVSSVTGDELTTEQIAKAYEVSKDQFVLIDPEELEQLAAPAGQRTVEITEFVPAAQIDPVHYERPYLVAPDKGGQRPYALLTAALTNTGRAGIGRIVMRGKEYLVALRAVDGRLHMSTMLFVDEVVDPAVIDELVITGVGVIPSEREVELATALVESSMTDWDPAKFADTYRERVLALIETKAAGGTVSVAPQAEAKAPVIDLMAALEASLEAKKVEAAPAAKKARKARKTLEAVA